MSAEQTDDAEWLREIAREEIDDSGIRPQHVRLGAKAVGTAAIGMTAIQLGALGKAVAQQTGPGAGTIGTEADPLTAVYADTIDRDRDLIHTDALSIDGDELVLDVNESVPNEAQNVRVRSDAIEIADGTNWDPAMAEWYGGSAWGGAVVERYDGNAWNQLYPVSAIPDSDFSQYTTGASPPDWTERFNSWTHTVEEDASLLGGKYLEATKGADEVAAFTWDDPGAATDQEIVGKMRTNDVSTVNAMGFVLRCDGTNAYVAEDAQGSGEVRVSKVLSGSYDGNFGSASFSMSAGTLYFWRFRVNGTNVKLKVWDANNSEPSSWDIEATDSDINSSGHAGIWQYRQGVTNDYDYVSVANGGSSATLP